MPDPRSLEVRATGPLTLVQDAGRPGFAHLGVTGSGAADRASFDAANRLVGNRAGAAALEVLLGGLVLRATATLLIATTGAPTTVTIHAEALPPSAVRPSALPPSALPPSAARLDLAARQGGRHGHPGTTLEPSGCSFTLFAGETLTVHPPERGLRNYLAVRGGIDVGAVLGSRSTDLLSGLGPPTLRPGDVLRVGDEFDDWPSAERIPPALRRADAVPTLHLTRGPRDDWFGDDGWATLALGTWQVGADSNRVGVRIVGDHPLPRSPGHEGELPSEGLVTGAVQVPPDGRPVIFLRDHPVTGGYPVIGVLTGTSIDALAQLRPGDRLRFQPKSIAASS